VARAVGETVPLASTMREEIQHLREWARYRTRPASPAPAGSPPGPRA
jgi:hypothetical protein